MMTFLRRALPLAIPFVVVLGGFFELVRHPAHVIADDKRPSLDHAAPPGTRGLGNDLTSFWLPKLLWDLRGRGTRGPLALSAWDPSGFAGRPASGNPQSSRGYPPYGLALALKHAAVLGWITSGHLIGGGVGLALLLRRCGVGIVGASVAGGYYACSPFLIGHTFEGHYPHVWAACWYPWAFLWLKGWMAGDAPSGLALALVLALTFLTGHPQEWYLLILTLSVVVASHSLQRLRTESWRAAALDLGLWVGLVGLSLTLCAAAIIPQVAAQAWTAASPASMARAGTRYHVHSIQLLQLLAPSALGGPHDFFGHDNYWETLLSVGLAPLVLAVLGAGRHPSRTLRLGLVGLVGITVILAGGQRLGLYALAVQVVPGMARFRVPARSLFLANLGAAMLAGLGLDVLRGRRLVGDDWLVVRTRLRRGILLAVAAVSLAGAFTRLAPPVAGLALPETGRDAGEVWAARGANALGRIGSDPVVWGTLLTVLTASLAAGDSTGSARRLGLVLGLIGLVEVTWLAHRVIIVAPVEAFRSTEVVGRWLSETLAGDPRQHRVAASPLGLSDLDAAEFGIETTNLNDSFQIGHAARLYERLYPYLEDARRRPRPEGPLDRVVAAFRAEQARLLARRLGVAYLVTRRGSGLSNGERVRRIDSPQAGIQVEQCLDPMPRCYVVPRAIEAPWRGDSVAGVLGRLDPREGVVLAKAPSLGEPRQPYRDAVAITDDFERIAIEVETEGAGFLVVANTWMPGWSARVDGREEEVLRGDFWLQTVPLRQAGRHRVVLEYRAPGRATGLVVSVLGSAVWVGLLARALSRRRRARLTAG